MYRLITFILLYANICIADIFAATVKECEVDSMYNDTLIVGKKVICGQKIYPQRDDVITACLAHERRLYLVGKLKDTLLVITDAPALFSNDAFCDVNFKHFKSPYYKCIKKKQGKTRYVHVVNKTDTLIFKKNDNKSSYSLQRGISNGRCLSCTFIYFPSNVSKLMYFFSLSFKIDFDKISHVIIRPLKNDERIWYSKYDIPMNSSKSLFHEIVLDKDQNEIINEDIYMTTFK